MGIPRHNGTIPKHHSTGAFVCVAAIFLHLIRLQKGNARKKANKHPKNQEVHEVPKSVDRHRDLAGSPEAMAEVLNLAAFMAVWPLGMERFGVRGLVGGPNGALRAGKAKTTAESVRPFGGYAKGNPK